MNACTQGSSQGLLSHLKRLIELGRRKKEAVLGRQHSELGYIAAVEGEILNALRQQRVDGRAGCDLTPESKAQLEAAVLELQHINATNAALLQEHLAGVVMCLELLESVAERPLLDVRA